MNHQPSLFDLPATFDGKTYDDQRDGDRLRSQLKDVERFLSDFEWHTLAEIAAKSGHPEASISARCRDLRKLKFGGYIIERMYAGNGLWKYRMKSHDDDLP